MINSGRVSRAARAMGLVVVLASLGTVDDAAAKGRWGFFGGANFADMGGDIGFFGEAFAAGLESETGVPWTSTPGGQTGFGGGVYYLLPMSSHAGFQFEVQHIRRGVSYDLTATGYAAEAGFHLNTFEIPILLRLSPGPEGATRAMFVIGPVFGFHSSVDFVASAEGESVSVDAGELFESPTIGGLVGAGVTVAVGETTALALQARFYLGLANALDTSVIESKAKDFGVFAGLEFDLGR